MNQYRNRSMGYDVTCKMLALIVGTEIPSTQIRLTIAKIVRIVKTADKLRGCKKEEYLKEIFKLSENINLSNRLTSQARVQGRGPKGPGAPPLEIEKQKKKSSGQTLSYFTSILLLF